MKNVKGLTLVTLTITSILPMLAIADTLNTASFSCENLNLIPIYDVQGNGNRSPLVPDGEFESVEEIAVKGIVTARGESLFKGFYLQDAMGDGSESTSDGIFIHLGEQAPELIQPGKEVCVQGKVQESYGQTQINLRNSQKIEIGNDGNELTAVPFKVMDGELLADALERYEGMKIVLDQTSDLVVTRSFSYDYAARRNNMVLSHKTPLIKPTQIYPVLSDAATDLAGKNSAGQLFIESDLKAANGVVPYYLDFNAEDGYIRIGDQLVNFEGVIGYNFNEYRFVATNSLTKGDVIHRNDRVLSPDIANKGDIRVASFNVLNFFNDVVGGDANPIGDNRGAQTVDEMLLQRTKIVNALLAMNADIVGLMEISNNGYGEKSAIQNLLTAINEELADSDVYAFIEIKEEDKYQGKFLGSDAIAVGMLYRPSKVTPSDAAMVIITPEQHVDAGELTRGEGDNVETNPDPINKYQRHSLGQTFEIMGEKLTVVVNHFKSKGSGCAEDWLNFGDDSDMQGSCSEFRVSAAKVVGDALKPTDGDILIIGDLNSYGQEDSVRVLTDYNSNTSARKIKSASWTTLNGEPYEAVGSAVTHNYGYVDLNAKHNGADVYSYSYNGELGSLDHVLGNVGVTSRVVAVEDWHINAVESNLFEYGSRYTGELAKSENAFSSSDHDPVIIALRYQEEAEDDGGSLGYFGLIALGVTVLLRRGKKSYRQH